MLRQNITETFIETTSELLRDKARLSPVCVCACVRVCVCVRAFVCVCKSACLRVGACVQLRLCIRPR